MAKYPFLSDEWIIAAKEIYEAHRGEAPPLPVTLRANLNITDVPFGASPLRAHLDNSTGELELEVGHLEKPDVTLTLGYDTAKAQIVNQDSQALVQAFMGGRIKVDGDLSKVLALAAGAGAGGSPAAEVAQEVAGQLQQITE